MRLILPCLFILLLPACGNREKKDSFKREQEQWQQERIERLKSDSGWLNLAGLYWLEEGENTFGSDSSNRIVFPAKAPARMGKYILLGDSLRFVPEDGAGIMYGGVPAREMAIKSDRAGNETVLESGSLAWFIIERGGRYAIRLRDFENPALKEFRGIESFEADRRWKVPAEFKAFPEPVEMLIPTLTGSVEKNLCPGILRFEAGGKRFELYPVLAGDRLFIIFADGTSGIETYGGGRFLYTELPGKDSTVMIDFNRAYNPPCAFTPFATCPLPPRENILPVRIEAGEKFGGH
jgi:uncharacterized protein (DUF1684 family)